MDKLEQYLDQVCRSIGGPRSLRQHVRQELREHLSDALAEHKAAGMSEEAALERALADFGGPELVRSELEATHGHRLLPVVIDKAMQWKERTMRAKWLWSTWAFLALALVIALEALFITFNVLYIVPKFQRLMRDGIIDPAISEEHGVAWMLSFQNGLMAVTGHYTTWLLLLAAAAWTLFEWRVKSEHKSFIRLSAFGTVAVGLMVVVALTAGSLVISFCLGVPAVGKIAKPFALQQIGKIDTSVNALEQALAKNDWGTAQEQVTHASEAIKMLSGPAAAVGALTPRYGPPTLEDLRTELKTANEGLREAEEAIGQKDAERAKAGLRKFHESYGLIGKAATRPER